MSPRLLALVALIACAAAFGPGAVHAAAAATYYVSPAGSDSNAGTSSVAPWRTVGRVNSAALAPGDTVLFQGGSTFGDATLMPGRSGASGSPITFGSYGVGQADLSGGIWFSGAHDLTFDGLTVDGGGSASLAGLQASGSGGGSTSIVVRNCHFTNLGIGILVSNPNDSGWTVSGNVIQHTHDSGVIAFGHDLTFSGNTIANTGEDTSISYGKHGIYAKGPHQTIVGNTITSFSANGISLRYHNDVVEQNTISGGPIGIGWFQNDATAGTTTIAYNKISNTSTSGIYISPSDSAGATSESFVIANNTISGAGGNGMDVERTSGSVTIANNAISGAVSPDLAIATPGGALSEHHDALWSTSTPYVDLDGSWKTVSAWQASGAGVGDISADPSLDSTLSPLTGSPLVDAGSAAVAGATYAPTCDGSPFAYCGSAPDIGAVETAAAAPASGTGSGPTVSLSVSATTVAAGSQVTASAQATSAVGVAWVAYDLDGVLQCADRAAPYTCSVTVSAGQHVLRVYGIDRNGGVTVQSAKLTGTSTTTTTKARRSR